MDRTINADELLRKLDTRRACLIDGLNHGINAREREKTRAHMSELAHLAKVVERMAEVPDGADT